MSIVLSHTGGIENNNHYQTVINEMFEETGIDIKNKKVKIHYLGKHYAINSRRTKTSINYQNWLKKNNLNGNCNAYFISKTSMLMFQVWEFEKLISETIWLKSDNEKWQFYIKILGEKFNKIFLLEEILKIEKDFVLKTFKEKQNL